MPLKKCNQAILCRMPLVALCRYRAGANASANLYSIVEHAGPIALIPIVTFTGCSSDFSPRMSTTTTRLHLRRCLQISAGSRRYHSSRALGTGSDGCR